MKREVKRTIERHHMLAGGGHLTVGLSGGADSVALIHVLRGLSEEYDVALTAVHVNHGIRGEEAHRDEAFVRDYCHRLRLPLRVERLDIPRLAKATGRSLELCAREERYAALRRHTPAGGRIATAHTLDDSVETFFLNLTRGAGLRGLCGIPPVRQEIVRPLIACTRERIERYCGEHGLSWVEDSTNRSDAYTRNRLRHRLLPQLRQFAPGLDRGLQGTFELLRADADYLDALADDALRRASREPHRYSADALRELPPPLRGRALLGVLRDHHIPLSRRRVADLERVLETGSPAELSGQWSCRVRRGILEFFPSLRESAAPPFSVELDRSEKERIIDVFVDKSVRLFVAGYEFYKESINSGVNHLKNGVDCDRIGKTVKLRQRLDGDSIRLAGRGCTKSLRKLCGEAGLNPWQRRRLLVLADERGPLWVEGFGIAERAEPHPASNRVLMIEIQGDR